MGWLTLAYCASSARGRFGWVALKRAVVHAPYKEHGVEAALQAASALALGLCITIVMGPARCAWACCLYRAMGPAR